MARFYGWHYEMRWTSALAPRQIAITKEGHADTCWLSGGAGHCWRELDTDHDRTPQRAIRQAHPMSWRRLPVDGAMGPKAC